MNKGKTIVSPGYTSWVELLDFNQCLKDLPRDLLDIRNELREQVFLEAVKYTSEVDSQSVDESFSAKSALVLTGHQPVIYHGGLLAKNSLLGQFVADKHIGINVIIDTDSGDAGNFFYPNLVSGIKTLARASLAANKNSLFIKQMVADVTTIDDMKSVVSEGLHSVELDYKVANFCDVLDFYRQFCGQPIVSANTAARRKFVGAFGINEVPLSKILTLPSINKLWAYILKDPVSLHHTYNKVLREFRNKNKIKNKANPFPDLYEDESKLELPFWLVDYSSGTRKPLYSEKSTVSYSEALADDFVIAPKAMLTTVLLRVFISDLFIHGLGGAKYDACTDEFIVQFFGIAAPKFTSVSDSYYLFPDQRKQLLAAEALIAQKREMYFHPKKFLDQDLFAAAAIEQIEKLVMQKQSTIEELKKLKQAGESVAELTQNIKKIESSIAAIVEEALESKLGRWASLDQREVDLLNFREFPYFFFMK